MRKFDLELAEAGHPVCTRDGKPVRIICFDVKGTDYPIVAAIMLGDVEYINQYSNKGEYYADGHESPGDLMMVSEVEESGIKEAIKYAIAASTHENGILINGVTENEAIAWLEKQVTKVSVYNDTLFKIATILSQYEDKDNSPLEKIRSIMIKDTICSMDLESKKKKHDESKFKVDDWIIDIQDGAILHINKVHDYTYGVTNLKGGSYEESRCTIETWYQLWTIQDAKDGDVLVADNGLAFIYNGYLEEKRWPFAYGGINIYGRFNINDGLLPFTHQKVVPAIKEQRDLLFQKIHEVGYVWNAEKKELRKIEPAWSEEDENAIKVLMNIIKKSEIIDPLIYTDLLKEKLYDWLKSLKDRFQQQNK